MEGHTAENIAANRTGWIVTLRRSKAGKSKHTEAAVENGFQNEKET